MHDGLKIVSINMIQKCCYFTEIQNAIVSMQKKIAIEIFAKSLTLNDKSSSFSQDF